MGRKSIWVFTWSFHQSIKLYKSIYPFICLSVHPSTRSIKDKRRWRPYNMGHQICNSRVNYILSGTDIWDTEGHQCISFKKVHHCKRITMETMPPSVHPTVLPWFYTIHLSSLWPSISPSTGVEQGWHCVARWCWFHSQCTHTCPGRAAQSEPGSTPS